MWPRSRKKTPKQFIDLAGKSPTFLESVKNAKQLTSIDKIFVITNADYVDEVISMSNLPLKNIFAEPEKRDTALAMVAMTAVIRQHDPQAVVVNLYSDHLIEKRDQFVKNMLLAANFAYQNDCLVLPGTKPTFPHTGLGYIQAEKDPLVFQGKKIFKASKFKEKPDLETAEKYLKAGNFYWNVGYYTWTAKALTAACKQHAPALFQAGEAIYQAWGAKNEQAQIGKIYRSATPVSIDRAIAEKVDNLYLVPSDFEWNDLGNWQKVWEMSVKDKNGMAVFKRGQGSLVNIESNDCLVDIKDKLVALVGVEDLIVIETGDALLITKKDKAQAVKAAVNFLEEKRKDDYL